MVKRRPLPVNESDYQNLRESGILIKTIRENDIVTKRGALYFPYRNLDGETNGFARRRPHKPKKIKGELVKYLQPEGSASRAYFPESCLHELIYGSDLFITEGEKKGLALAQIGVAAIALGGVYSWLKDGELIEDVRQLDLNDRRVYITFDFDEKESTRQNVTRAKMALAKALEKEGANVFSVDLPPGLGGCKQGVDDYLVAHGEKAFLKLVLGAKLIHERISSNYLIYLAPPALSKEIYHGFIGEFLNAVSDYTEATDAGILGHLLPAIGCVIGPGPHIWAGSEQPARFNTCIVGPTSTGRKGTALSTVGLLMDGLEDDFWDRQKVGGLSSGEGLIAKVSDYTQKDGDGEKETVVVDKRLYVVESEFAKVLTQIRRDQNILSQVMREAYDSGNLAVLTRNPLHANNAHICITGHITPEELRKRFTQVDMANGFGNRFLWFAVKSEKVIAEPVKVPFEVIVKYQKKLRGALCKVEGWGKKESTLSLNGKSKEIWKSVYPGLREDKPGLIGALTARGESVVLRLAVLYALLDGKRVITPPHLEAALAIWRYNEESVAILFQDQIGDGVADTIYRLLAQGPMKQKEFYSHISQPAVAIKSALLELENAKKIKPIRMKKAKGAGRPATLWKRLE